MPAVSKGDRFPVTGRLPTTYRPKLKQWVQITGESQSDLVARLLMHHLENYDPEEHRGQQKLNVDKTT